MIPEREREALMRLTMCARGECPMCKYEEQCDNWDFRMELATKNMNILADALRAEPTEPRLEQFRVGLEYHTDSVNFGKPKGESITTNKTEQNSSEKANNCESCRHYTLACDLFSEICKYEPKDEPMKTTDYCDVCNHKGCDNCIADGSNPYCVPSHYEPKDEPQTCDDCIWNVCNYNKAFEDEPQTEKHCETCRHKDECEGATYEYKNTEWWCLAYAPIDEPQTDCAWK